jgi:hypothetical protein
MELLESVMDFEEVRDYRVGQVVLHSTRRLCHPDAPEFFQNQRLSFVKCITGSKAEEPPKFVVQLFCREVQGGELR